MDPITRSQARKNLIELEVPPFALSIFDDDPLPNNWDITFSTPYYVLDDCEDQQPAYGKGRITPLWAEGDYVTAYHHDPSRRGYFRFCLEDGEERQPIGLSWNQMLVKPFVFLLESGDPVEELRELAGLLAFAHLETLMQDHSITCLDTFEKSDSWYEDFLRRIK